MTNKNYRTKLECGCILYYHSRGFPRLCIEYCPTHKAAPEYHNKAHQLAMFLLQAELYRYPDIRDLVNNILTIHKRVEGKEEYNDK